MVNTLPHVQHQTSLYVTSALRLKYTSRLQSHCKHANLKPHTTRHCTAVSLWTSPYIPDAAYIDLRWASHMKLLRSTYHVKNIRLSADPHKIPVLCDAYCWHSPSGPKFLSVTCMSYKGPQFVRTQNFNLSLFDSYVLQSYPHHSRLADLDLTRLQWPMSVNAPPFLHFRTTLRKTCPKFWNRLYKFCKLFKVCRPG
jgi:hypothetical protein